MREDLRAFMLKQQEFAKNTSTRLPICLMIDTSLSMKQEDRMKRINAGIKKFISDLKDDPYAATSVELCIITFGTKARVHLPFTEIGKVDFSDLKPDGDTPLGEATELAIKSILERLELYDNKGVTHFHPWIIIFSDGKANNNKYKPMARELCNYQIQNKWKALAVSLGDQENSLKDFTPSHNVRNLDNFDASDFFAFISRSVSSMTKSRPDIADDNTDLLGEFI